MLFNINKKLIISSIFLFLLLAIPVSFAEDSVLDNITATDGGEVISSDYYFNSSLDFDIGDGSIESPYKVLKSDRVTNGSTIHLASGVYDYDPIKSHKDLVVIGHSADDTFIDCKGAVFKSSGSLTLYNITFLNSHILNEGTLRAENVVFNGGYSADSTDFSTEFGGAIYSNENSVKSQLFNCTFVNNHAKHGGAIFVAQGELEVIDCNFINNTAYFVGGAVACEDKKSRKPVFKIRNSTFINSLSLYSAGGALYLKSTTVDGNILKFINSSSSLGSAITLISSNAIFTNIEAYNNTALGDGGVIYQVYGNLTVNNSIFKDNSARNGAVLFLDRTTKLIVENNMFANNSARFTAGAVYSISNNNTRFDNNSYENNHAMYYNDLLDDLTPNLVIVGGNYSIYYNELNPTDIPGKYDSRDYGYVTSVKNQGTDGNCWAFAALAVLESNILKAGGGNIDFSENNMKNLASLYSQYGWNMQTNEGGYLDMGIGYLTSWIGPILDSDDIYFNDGVLSPVLDSIMHVQNIMYLKRFNTDDVDSIKKAIMDYGAVLSGIYMVAPSNDPYQCYQGIMPNNHAVALVGWDDDMEIKGAPGKGAWIAKNSWGTEWGDNGYFYVSYYDHTCPRVGITEGVTAFILNDTVKYDKNYQYDLAKTDYFFKKTNTAWYKNIFTATDNEYLAAVSTYFEKATNWDLTIFVNGTSKLTKSGYSNPGYYTIDLGEFIPMNAGDVFEVQFKIKVLGDVGVPISEKISLNVGYYKSGVSYVSWNGTEWFDFYDLKGTYPDHSYDSQVACIKAFTVFNPVNTTLDLVVLNRTSEYFEVQANVFNEYGYALNTGVVLFSVDDVVTSVPVKNGIARFTIDLSSINKVNLTAEFNASGYVSSKHVCKVSNTLVNTTTQIILSNSPYNPINITAMVLDEDNNPAEFGFVIFNVSGELYSIRVVNGTAKLTDFNVNPGNNHISAYFSDMFYYKSSNDAREIDISLKDTQINLTYTSANPDANNPLVITANITDFEGIPVKSGFVKFNIAGEEIIVDVEDGIARLTYVFTEIGLNTVSAHYSDKYVYNSSFANFNVVVSKIKVNLTFNSSFDFDNYETVMRIGIQDALKPFVIYYDEDGIATRYDSTDGYVIIQLLRNFGSYSYVIILDSPIYEAEDLAGTYDVSVQMTMIDMASQTLCTGGEYSVVLKDLAENAISNRWITLHISDKVYRVKTDENGKATFYLNVSPGSYSVDCEFDGDSEYIKSYNSLKVNIKSSVALQSTVRAQNSKVNIQFFSKQATNLADRDVVVYVNGVKYNVRTNALGVASISINLKPGQYLVKASNPETAESFEGYLKVVKRISNNYNVVMYYGSGKSYSVKVYDDNGKIAKGVTVVFKINGKSYKRVSDAKGIASFKITLNPGTYTITASYMGVKVSNKVNVKSTIVTKDIKVKKGKPIKFTAKLLNSKGKIIKNKKVTFKFQGKTYKIKTNKKGIATLKITKKYKKGKYTITSKYGKLTIKNSIKIR